MARLIRGLCLGDSITQGAISGVPGQGYSLTVDPDSCFAGQLEDSLVATGEWEFVTNVGIGGSPIASWLPGSSDRLAANVPTHERQPPGPPGNQPLWDWGVVPQLPLDVVFLLGEINGMTQSSDTRAAARPQDLVQTYELLIQALFGVGVGCVILSSHGLPDLRNEGNGELSGASVPQWMGAVSDGLQMVHGYEPRVQRGVDCPVLYGAFPQTAFYGDSNNTNAQDVHPNQVGHDTLADDLLLRVAQTPRYLMQPDETGG